MPFLIDTNVAIYLRDGDPQVTARLLDLGEPPNISLITLVELESGVVAKSTLSARRRERLDLLLAEIGVLGFDRATVLVYRSIIEQVGYSRRRVFDRLIAATAIVHGLTLVTINGDDFRDIPNLALEVWPAPAQ